MTRSPLAFTFSLALSACGGTAAMSGTDGGGTPSAPDLAMSQPNGCTLAANTTATATVNSTGCHVLARDTAACEAARKAAGLSGYWLRFSCRVTLSTATSNGASVVRAASDGRPDYTSFYFPSNDACYEVYNGAIHNPNEIKAQKLTVDFPVAPNMTTASMRGTAVVGLALNGVPIFGNFAAPGDDIYRESMTFDRCGAHPENTGNYHYHAEPYSISYDDSNFIGVMRDGYPIYGRRDKDGSMPTVDAYGGHTAVTADSPNTPVYHYHVNQQTSTSPGTAGQKQWFLTTGQFRGTPASCTTCN